MQSLNNIHYCLYFEAFADDWWPPRTGRTHVTSSRCWAQNPDEARRRQLRLSQSTVHAATGNAEWTITGCYQWNWLKHSSCIRKCHLNNWLLHGKNGTCPYLQKSKNIAPVKPLRRDVFIGAPSMYWCARKFFETQCTFCDMYRSFVHFVICTVLFCILWCVPFLCAFCDMYRSCVHFVTCTVQVLVCIFWHVPFFCSFCDMYRSFVHFVIY